MTVREFLDGRNISINDRKKIRILDHITHKSYGPWWENSYALIKEVKATDKYLFIFI